MSQLLGENSKGHELRRQSRGKLSHTHERQPKSSNRLGERTLTHTVCKSAKVNNRVEAKHSGRKYILRRNNRVRAPAHTEAS